MKTFVLLFGVFVGFQLNWPQAEFSNEHMVLNYPEDWVVRPIQNTSKENIILETEKLSIWSPLMPDTDRKTLKLTSPSSIYYKNEPSIKRIDREVWKGAKDVFQDIEKISEDQGVKGGIPYIRTVFSHKIGIGYEVMEYYVFAVRQTPYVLYLTSSRKEYNSQKEVWNEIWSNIDFN